MVCHRVNSHILGLFAYALYGPYKKKKSITVQTRKIVVKVTTLTYDHIMMQMRSQYAIRSYQDIISPPNIPKGTTKGGKG